MKQNDIIKLKQNIPELNLVTHQVGKVVDIYGDGLCLIEIDNKRYILTDEQFNVLLLASLWNRWRNK